LKRYTDIQIIQGIRERDPKIFKYLYDNYYSIVKLKIIENNGTEADVKDVFQEAIVLIYRKIDNNTLQMQSSFKNYLLTVSWYLWMREVRTKDNQSRINNYFSDVSEDFEDINIKDEEIDRHNKYKLYQEHFKQLSEKCREVLKLFFEKMPLKDIARKLGLKNERSVKKRKYFCKEKLVESIKNDPRFKSYYEQ